MYPIQVLLRFACFDILYVTAKGALDLFWGYPAGQIYSFEFITTLTIVPFFILADGCFYLFEKREKSIFLYDALFLTFSLPFIASLLRNNATLQAWWIRAVHMVINRNAALGLYLPLFPAVVLGYYFYGWMLKSAEPFSREKVTFNG